jgi:hypothetical protein
VQAIVVEDAVMPHHTASQARKNGDVVRPSAPVCTLAVRGAQTLQRSFRYGLCKCRCMAECVTGTVRLVAHVPHTELHSLQVQGRQFSWPFSALLLHAVCACTYGACVHLALAV